MTTTGPRARALSNRYRSLARSDARITGLSVSDFSVVVMFLKYWLNRRGRRERIHPAACSYVIVAPEPGLCRLYSMSRATLFAAEPRTPARRARARGRCRW